MFDSASLVPGHGGATPAHGCHSATAADLRRSAGQTQVLTYIAINTGFLLSLRSYSYPFLRSFTPLQNHDHLNS
jgi:hypothetical protein